MLWVDKYRPTSLEKMSYHTAMATRLARLAESDYLPHMLFYGPSGAGKKTRIMAMLRKVYGAGVEKSKFVYKTCKTPSGKTVEVTTVASRYHVEINPGDAGIYDRFVVQEIIKTIAEDQESSVDKHKFRVVLLTEVDRLTKEAQHALRRTMETYTSVCRLILCCESPSRVIEPVRSRCLGIRVAAPSTADVMGVLETVCKREGLRIDKAFAAKVANHAKGNLRRAILMLQTCKMQQYPFVLSQPIPTSEWEQFTALTARDIVTEQSPKQFLAVRAKLYQLLVNCIPAVTIMKSLSEELIKLVDVPVKSDIAKYAAFYEHRLQLGQKDIFHLDAFVAKVMSVIKSYLVTRFG